MQDEAGMMEWFVSDWPGLMHDIPLSSLFPSFMWQKCAVGPVRGVKDGRRRGQARD